LYIIEIALYTLIAPQIGSIISGEVMQVIAFIAIQASNAMAKLKNQDSQNCKIIIKIAMSYNILSICKNRIETKDQII
jgi:hypothetical protein